MFGNERAFNHLHACAHLSAAEIIDSFYQAVADFSKVPTLQDDISLVVLKIL